MLNSPIHSYEEVREIVVDVLLSRQAGLFSELLEAACRGLLDRDNGGRWFPPAGQTGIAYEGAAAYLRPEDSSSILEVFWDLFRQGAVTLGHNAAQPGWPAYRLTRFGQQIAHKSPYRFHDTESYITLVRSYAPAISPEAVEYLEEASAAFYADCLLASSVMLGVAAEAEFLRLVEVACKSASYGAIFTPVSKPLFIRQKILKFLAVIKPLISSLPKEATEDLETNFNAIQSVLRIARNEAGHPTAVTPQREQVYINLQLFAPFVRQVERLRSALG
jgi:hypothetical protein